MFRIAFQVLAQALNAQANGEVVVPVKPNVSTTTSRVRYFIRMNPFEFYGSTFEEDRQDFINEVYKLLTIMGVSPVEKGKIGCLSTNGCCSNLVQPMERSKTI